MQTPPHIPDLFEHDPHAPPTSKHTGVVPSFCISLLRDSLPASSGTEPINPEELLCWKRPTPLTERHKTLLREEILARMRKHGKKLWSTPLTFGLPATWSTRMPQPYMKLVEQLAITGERPLQGRSVREIKDLLRIPLVRLLALLAEIEALDWIAPAKGFGTTSKQRRVLKPDSLVENNESVQDLARQVMALRWIKSVSPDDLRFAYGAAQPLDDWLTTQLYGSQVASSVVDLMQGIVQAERMTAHEEAQALARLLVLERWPHHADPSRQTQMLLMRQIASEGPGLTLNEVGEHFGLTRERIRQVCAKLEETALEQSIATPALDRVIAAAARICPLSCAEIDEQLMRFIGDGAGIESLLGWATFLGKKDLPICIESTTHYIDGQPVQIKIIDRTNSEPWTRKLLQHAKRECSVMGCTNAIRLAGRMALSEGLCIDKDSMESAIQQVWGFRWLEKESGWFTIGDTDRCSAASRIYKLVTVAHEAVGADQIAAALAGDDMWLYRGDGAPLEGFAVPPVHILRELMLGWSWLRVLQKGRFLPAKRQPLEEVLNETEIALVKTIEAHQGIACRFELKDVVIHQLGLTDVRLSLLLGSSTIISKVEHGLYAIRGRRVADTALLDARARYTKRTQKFQTRGEESDSITIEISPASLINEQFSIPRRWRESMSGKTFALYGSEGKEIGEARVTASGALKGVHRHFPQARAGDTYNFAIRDGALHVRWEAASLDTPKGAGAEVSQLQSA